MEVLHAFPILVTLPSSPGRIHRLVRDPQRESEFFTQLYSVAHSDVDPGKPALYVGPVHQGSGTRDSRTTSP